MKAPQDYNSKRLCLTNIEDYLKKKYNAKEVKETSSKVLKITPLLQRDYGEENDCTLTSITTCVNYYTKGSHQVTAIYDKVEKVAKKFFYKGNVGTFPLFIQQIYNEVLKVFPCSKTKTAQGYLKGVGFNFNTIKNVINKSTPMILSINDDGRKYYKNHSITIIGYKTYKIDNKHEAKILVLYDNWHKSESLLDYDILSVIASINY